MSGRAQRNFRKQANQVARETTFKLAPALEAVLSYAKGTQDRVEKLEAVLSRPFRGRLRWLLTGK